MVTSVSRFSALHDKSKQIHKICFDNISLFYIYIEIPHLFPSPHPPSIRSQKKIKSQIFQVKLIVIMISLIVLLRLYCEVNPFPPEPLSIWDKGVDPFGIKVLIYLGTGVDLFGIEVLIYLGLRC